MRTVCGLIAVLLILGPIGMGMLFNVNAPKLEAKSSFVESVNTLPEHHGTRSEPMGSPAFVALYFHRTGNTMNTSGINYINPATNTGDIAFTLQSPLKEKFFVVDPQGGPGMRARIYLGGVDSGLTVNVYENQGGSLIGSGSTGAFSYGSIPQYILVDIPFQSGYNHTFSKGSSIYIQFDFTLGTGILHYDYSGRLSNLRLNGKSIIDISLETRNFDNEKAKLFYPHDIDFPEERKKVIMDGKISDVFGKTDGKYISSVQIQIQNGAGMNDTWDADYDRQDYKYDYTWDYQDGETSGEYTVTTHVFDEQNNEFKIVNHFNMSSFGVVLTSPDTEPDAPEGTYKADAKRYVPLNNVTRYTINVWNVGNAATAMNISATGPSGWDWWLEGNDIQIESDNKKGTIPSFAAGQSRTFTLAVDSQNNPLGSQSTIVVTATCAADPRKDYDTLNTISTVAQKYDLQLRFIPSDTKTEEKIVELGDQAKYNFRVTNTGGTNDTIWLDIAGNLPSGWTRVLKLVDGTNPKTSGGRYYVVLDPQGSKDFTLTLTAPDSGEDDEFDLDIEGESQGSQSQSLIVTDKITLTTILTMGIELELINDGVQDVDPGDEVDYIFRIENTGTKSADFSVSFTTSAGGLKTQDISFSEKEFSNVDPDDDKTFTMTVEPSADIEAGNHSITVKVIRNDDPNVYMDKTVFTIVNAFPSLELIEPSPATAELYGEGSPGENVKYTISFRNTGNVKLNVQIILTDKPQEWTLDFGNGTSVWSEDIKPGDTKEVDFSLGIPDDAEGDDTVDITVSVTPNQGEPIIIETHTKVKGSFSQTLFTLLVPILLFVVIIVMVVVIYRRR